MTASGKSLLGLWLYRSGEQEWSIKHGSPLHKVSSSSVVSNSTLNKCPVGEIRGVSYH